MNSRRVTSAAKASNASSIASQASLVASFSFDGRGKSLRSSYKALASPAVVKPAEPLGGVEGREGGSFIVNLVDGGLVGGVVDVGMAVLRLEAQNGR